MELALVVGIPRETKGHTDSEQETCRWKYIRAVHILIVSKRLNVDRRRDYKKKSMTNAKESTKNKNENIYI